MQLDLANNDSIQTFVNNFSKTYKKCDILINNAGLAFKGADPTPHQDQAEPTLRTNFFGTCNFIDNMLPFLKESAKQGCEPRMVNVASMAGKLSQLRQDKQIEISSDKLTMTGLRKMCEDFVISTKQLKHKQEGWSGSNYGMSKCALIAAAKRMVYEKFIGFDMGPSRRPLLPFVGDKNDLFNELDSIGFFNHTTTTLL